MRENDSVENSGGVSEAAERARGYSPPEGPGGFPLFQGLNLLPLATVERNLQLCAEMAMLPKKQWTRRADDLITRLGLESLRHKKAGSLSGGQAQRAALARTMMKDSDVLLLDEPTSGLDDGNTEIIKNLIREYPADKICILSTHDSRLFDLTHEIIDFNLSVSL